MKTVTLGRSQVTSSRLAYGCWRIATKGDAAADYATAKAAVFAAVDAGYTLFDHADIYCDGEAERVFGRILKENPGLRSKMTIATKGGIVRPSPERWDADGRPAHLRAACEASLRRLRIERIDLYQLHTIDPRVPLEDSLGEIARLQQEGKIRHVGVSNFDAAELARARRVVKIVSVQNRYNVADRSSDPVLAICERDGLAFIPWSPLTQGPRDADAGPRRKLEDWARQRGVSFAQAAIAWLLSRSPAMLPIPGTSRAGHLGENVAAASLRLTGGELRAVG
jgi:aryl-alcohol dehydrogenase-like predicted oxidoreductase